MGLSPLRDDKHQPMGSPRLTYGQMNHWLFFFATATLLMGLSPTRSPKFTSPLMGLALHLEMTANQHC